MIAVQSILNNFLLFNPKWEARPGLEVVVRPSVRPFASTLTNPSLTRFFWQLNEVVSRCQFTFAVRLWDGQTFLTLLSVDRTSFFGRGQSISIRVRPRKERNCQNIEVNSSLSNQIKHNRPASNPRAHMHHSDAVDPISCIYLSGSWAVRRLFW